MNFKSFYNKFFGKDIYYLYSMTIYHILIIIFSILGIASSPHIFYKLSLFSNDVSIFIQLENIRNILFAYFIVVMIFLMDLIFLTILMHEFKSLKLSFKKLLLIEFVLIGISFFIPFFRDMMFFMTINSIQIYIVYRILLKNIWFLKPLFIFMSYVFIAKLIIFAFWS